MPNLPCLGREGRDGRPFLALVSPSIRAAYGEGSLRLNAFLRSTGALAVIPVDSGIPEFAERCAGEISGKPRGLWILSACPAARPFLEREFPRLSARILNVASPMALRSLRALRERELADSGYIVAVTPCAHKKMEEKTQRPEMIVVRLGDLLEESRQAGIDPFSYRPEPYDGEMPEQGSHCRIAEAVAERLIAAGRKARAVRIDGEEAARAFFGTARTGKPEAGEDADLIVELDFCAGGCSVA